MIIAMNTVLFHEKFFIFFPPKYDVFIISIILVVILPGTRILFEKGYG